MSNALVELHCHILPGIDDGAKDLDMSMSLIRKELQDGAAGIVFTPHFHYERISVEQFTARRKVAFLQVSAACRAEGLRLAGKMGAEVFYSTALPSLDLRQLAFAGSNYILIEFPTTMHPPGIDETLYAIRAQGYTPILAHVERYPFVTEDPTLLYNWVCDGCLAQINATGLIRNGHTAKWLHKLIEWNLVHILCSDCHHPVKRPPNLAEGFAHLPDKVARRMQRNAIDIYLGDDLRPPRADEAGLPLRALGVKQNICRGGLKTLPYAIFIARYPPSARPLPRTLRRAHASATATRYL